MICLGHNSLSGELGGCLGVNWPKTPGKWIIDQQPSCPCPISQPVCCSRLSESTRLPGESSARVASGRGTCPCPWYTPVVTPCYVLLGNAVTPRLLLIEAGVGSTHPAVPEVQWKPRCASLQSPGIPQCLPLSALRERSWEPRCPV